MSCRQPFLAPRNASLRFAYRGVMVVKSRDYEGHKMPRSAGRARGENKKLDKDVELVKIHVFSERAHTRYTTIVTTSYAIFVGFVVVFYTLFFEKVYTLDVFIFGVTVLTGGTAYELYRVHQAYRKALKKTSDLIEAVKQGRELPKLEELLKS
jgi:hypothetical protein